MNHGLGRPLDGVDPDQADRDEYDRLRLKPEERDLLRCRLKIATEAGDKLTDQMRRLVEAREAGLPDPPDAPKYL